VNLTQTDAADSLAVFFAGHSNQSLCLRLATANPLLEAADVPWSRSQPGRTMARRSLCNHVQAVK
jgi:hypothetical protein